MFYNFVFLEESGFELLVKPMTAKIVILGGGYAGLSSALALCAQKDISVTLVDPKPFFLQSVKLHQSVHRPLSTLQIPYEKIGKGLNLDFVCAKWEAQTGEMEALQRKQEIRVEGRSFSFDYLLLATGSRAHSALLEQETDPNLRGKELLSLEDIKSNGAKSYLEALEDRIEERKKTESSEKYRREKEAALSVLGGGPTAIQFLFEISSYFKKRKKRINIQLLHSQSQLLKAYPTPFHEYCYAKIKKEGISYYPQCRFLRQEKGRLVFEKKGQETSSLSSDLSFLFCGVEAHPHSFCTDIYGRLLWNGKLLDRIYSAGDCSDYSLESKGLNSMSGQAALRKGRLVASNIIRSLEQREARLLRYLYPEMGAFVSLGPWDGIGWLFVNFNILRGKAAFLAKEAIESQFRLLLSGIDSYVDL